MCVHPSLGKCLKFCITSFLHCCLDLFQRTPCETLGLLTTLDSPDAQEMCLTPTQEITTCDEREARLARGVYSVWYPSFPPPPSFRPRQNGLKCRTCRAWAWKAACARALQDLHCSHITSVASHEHVQMADVQCDQQSACERVAYQAALQVVPTTLPTTPVAPMQVEAGQLVQIDMATPRASQLEWQGNSEALDPTAVVSWSDEQLLELPTSLPAMRTHPRGPRQRTCIVHKNLLQQHTHCHHQWVKRRDSESLQAELASPR